MVMTNRSKIPGKREAGKPAKSDKLRYIARISDVMTVFPTKRWTCLLGQPHTVNRVVASGRATRVIVSTTGWMFCYEKSAVVDGLCAEHDLRLMTRFH